jgi:hypothetical protein
VNGRPMQWHIVVWLSPDREFCTSVFATTVGDAICAAICEAKMGPEELVHEIHVSPPKPVN